jgi:hypothetical protein
MTEFTSGRFRVASASTFSLEPIDIHLKYMHVYTFQAKIDLTASVGAAYLKSLG